MHFQSCLSCLTISKFISQLLGTNLHLNFRPISIDSSHKQNEFLRLVSRENQRFFWTGGKMVGGKFKNIFISIKFTFLSSGDQIRWPSGIRFNDVDWSETGG